MIKRPIVRWGLRLYLWQALVGIAAYVIVYQLLVDSLPPASLDGKISAEAWSDWWRKSSGDFVGVVPMVIGIGIVYLGGYWYWLSRYFYALAKTTARLSWLKLSITGLLQLLVSLLLIALPGLLVATLLGDPTEAVSERPFLQGITGASILGTALAVAIGVPLVRTKYLLASTDIGLWAAIKDGYNYSSQRSRRHLGIVLTTLLVTVVLLWISSRLSSIGSSSIALIILSIVLYQTVMLARCMLRSWTIYKLSHEQNGATSIN